MTTDAPLPKDNPMLVAFRAYQETSEYANSKRWATHSEHVDGSMWAAFVSGYRAGGEVAQPDAYRVVAWPKCECPTCQTLRKLRTARHGEA